MHHKWVIDAVVMESPCVFSLPCLCYMIIWIADGKEIILDKAVPVLPYWDLKKTKACLIVLSSFLALSFFLQITPHKVMVRNPAICTHLCAWSELFPHCGEPLSAARGSRQTHRSCLCSQGSLPFKSQRFLSNLEFSSSFSVVSLAVMGKCPFLKSRREALWWMRVSSANAHTAWTGSRQQ